MKCTPSSTKTQPATTTALMSTAIPSSSTADATADAVDEDTPASDPMDYMEVISSSKKR